MLIAAIFVYTTAVNIYQRPEGIKISSFFIAAMILVSLVSRAMRSTELRITGIEFSAKALEMLAEDEDQIIRVIARRPQEESAADLERIERAVRKRYGLEPTERVYFFEVEKSDSSVFDCTLTVDGEHVGKTHVLRARSPVVANSIAALLIELEKRTGRVPQVYFKWKSGNPVANVFRFIFLGEGDAAPLTHEVLRRAVKDPDRLPIVHVS